MISILLLIVFRHYFFIPITRNSDKSELVQDSTWEFQNLKNYSGCPHEGIFSVHINNIPRILVSIPWPPCMHACVLSPFSCVWLCATPGSSLYEILQARILEWVAMPFSRGSSLPRDWTRVSCGSLSSLFSVNYFSTFWLPSQWSHPSLLITINSWLLELDLEALVTHWLSPPISLAVSNFHVLQSLQLIALKAIIFLTITYTWGSCLFLIHCMVHGSYLQLLLYLLSY